MLRLVNNVIDISKMETGILKGDFHYYNLISIVEDVTLSVKNYAEQKSINIHFDTNCEEFISKSNCNMIERIVLTLLSNDIKFKDVYKNIYIKINTNNKNVKIFFIFFCFYQSSERKDDTGKSSPNKSPST